MWRLLRAELATLTRHLTDTLRPGYSVTSWGSARRRSGGSSGLKRRRTRWSGSQAWDDVISAANTAHIMAAKSWTLCLLWATIVHRRTDAIYRTSSMKQWTEGHQCDVPRLDVLTYARQFLLWAYFTYLLWWWILCVGLFLGVVFTRRFRFACVLVIMAGNCFWCILEEMFLAVGGVYNGRLCGRSFSWTSGEVVAVRRVGVFVLVRFA